MTEGWWEKDQREEKRKGETEGAREREVLLCPPLLPHSS